MPAAGGWLTTKKAGDMLGVHEQTVRRMIKEEELPAIQTEGGQYRLRLADVNAYLAAQGQTATREAVAAAVVHHAGGTGKTTTALNLAYHLADQGLRVCVVDLDPQADFSERLDLRPLAPSLADILKGKATGTPARLTCSWGGIAAQFDVIPGVLDEMADVEAGLMGLQLREQRLARALAPLRKQYDVLLYDCPPSLSLLTTNALWAADGVIIPVQAQDKAVRQLGKIIGSVQQVQEFREGPPVILGIVLTMFAAKERMSQEVEQTLREAYGDQVFATTIPRRTRMAEDARYNAPVALFAPGKDGADAYAALAQEVITRARN